MKIIEQESIEDYFKTHDTKYISEDAVFINMDSNELTIGREAIGNMLHYIYKIAFDAQAEIINTVITKNKAILEANFIGKHIGEFAGIPASYKKVKVPLCVSYQLENGLITKARIYLMTSNLIAQISN